jgi:hypothetical protein
MWQISRFIAREPSPIYGRKKKIVIQHTFVETERNQFADVQDTMSLAYLISIYPLNLGSEARGKHWIHSA